MVPPEEPFEEPELPEVPEPVEPEVDEPEVEDEPEFVPPEFVEPELVEASDELAGLPLMEVAFDEPSVGVPFIDGELGFPVVVVVVLFVAAVPELALGALPGTVTVAPVPSDALPAEAPPAEDPVPVRTSPWLGFTPMVGVKTVPTAALVESEVFVEVWANDVSAPAVRRAAMR